MRVVSVLSVSHPAVWSEVESVVPLAPFTEGVLDATRRIVGPEFARDAAPVLTKRGLTPLIRFARRAPVPDASPEPAAPLPRAVAAFWGHVWRHQQAGQALGSRVWDPEGDAPLVDALVGAGLIVPIAGEAPPRAGEYRVVGPAPAEPPFDPSDAVMPAPDDLDAPPHGAVALLHDMASLAAALLHHPVRMTHAGTPDVAAARRVGARLASPILAERGKLADDPRWDRAMRGLSLLGAVRTEPIERSLLLDPHLEEMLAGTVGDAADRLVRRLVEPDLHPLLPLVRAALAAAAGQALDEVVLADLVFEQAREVLYRPWRRDGVVWYPFPHGDPTRPFDRDGFDALEARHLRDVLRVLHRLGLIRRSPGVIAPTHDGLSWAGVDLTEHAPIWIGSDLELIVPPESVTPWERFQIERLAVCLARDVVDRYRLDRRGVAQWLATHEIDEALGLLDRRARAVPSTVRESLRAWADGALRLVLTHGVVLDP